MKIFLFFLTFLFTTPGFGQSQFQKVVKEYYRVNPSEGKLSAFIKALSDDPELLNKSIVLKTDSTNYFLKGEYQIFNPFSINAEKIEVVFAEQRHELDSDDIQTRYTTTYSYQITGYFDDTPANRSHITKDYDKIKRRLKREMTSEIIDLKGIRDITAGEITNFYYSSSIVYPITISWQTLPKSNKLAITVLTRYAK